MHAWLPMLDAQQCKNKYQKRHKTKPSLRKTILALFNEIDLYEGLVRQKVEVDLTKFYLILNKKLKEYKKSYIIS